MQNCFQRLLGYPVFNQFKKKFIHANNLIFKYYNPALKGDVFYFQFRIINSDLATFVFQLHHSHKKEILSFGPNCFQLYFTITTRKNFFVPNNNNPDGQTSDKLPRPVKLSFVGQSRTQAEGSPSPLENWLKSNEFRLL